jgi:hypothetical protein
MQWGCVCISYDNFWLVSLTIIPHSLCLCVSVRCVRMHGMFRVLTFIMVELDTGTNFPAVSVNSFLAAAIMKTRQRWNGTGVPTQSQPQAASLTLSAWNNLKKTNVWLGITAERLSMYYTICFDFYENFTNFCYFWRKSYGYLRDCYKWILTRNYAIGGKYPIKIL